MKVSHSGFTLIELVIVIVLLGILGAMGAGFISQAFKGFSDTDIRMEIYEEGKTALMRMEREIHMAVPNAVLVPDTGDSISLGVIDENLMAGVFGQYMEEHPSGGTAITDRLAGLAQNTLVSIYNTSWDVFADGSRIYNVVSSGTNPMTLAGGVDDKIGPASPYRRFYAVRDQAVRFRIAGTILHRETASVAAGSPLAGFTNAQPLAGDLYPAKDAATGENLPFFTYTPGTATRNGLVSIHFAISRNGETVNFHKEVQIRNVP